MKLSRIFPGILLLVFAIVLLFHPASPNPTRPGQRAFRTSVPPYQARAGDIWICPKDGSEMVYIPAGDFIMGSNDKNAPGNEQPAHRVYLDAFWIDRTEVTNAQFHRFVRETGYRSEDEQAGFGFSWKNFYMAGQDRYPVRWVNWGDAAAYARWAGKSLPTEAQWEKAARGTDGRRYPWGNLWKSNYLNLADCFCVVGPVGNFPAGASPYGVLDMAGNVREWCADYYDPNIYSHSPRRNPIGPPAGEARVCRGGSFGSGPQGFRVTIRERVLPNRGDDRTGFRCVLPAR